MKIKAIKTEKITTDLEITGATLLSVEELELVPKSLRNYEDWWWLRSPGRYSNYTIAVVSPSGSIYHNGNSVYFSKDAVRPALRIKNLKSSNLKNGDIIFFGNKEFEIISNTLAFCTTDIGCHYFNPDCEEEEANIYETSNMKKLIDYWFEKSKKDIEGE